MAISIDGTGTITGISVGGLNDSIITSSELANGAVTAAKIDSLPAGSILQVVQTEKTDVSSAVTGTAWTDFGLSVDITPSSTSSKILILCKLQLSNSNGYDVKQRLMRDSTPIFIGDAAGSRPQATSTYIVTYHSGYSSVPVSFSYLDSPGTTSPVTYKVQGSNYVSGTVWLNRGPNDTNNADYESRTASSIIVMEVAG